ncbi:MAG: hypothetical protein AB7O32_05325 [Vicinamibacterales bacterium]|jgi:hypothetical protein
MADPQILAAYIDPGTGSYLLQMAIAGLLGAGYTVRRFWSHIAARLGRSSTSAQDDGRS